MLSPNWRAASSSSWATSALRLSSRSSTPRSLREKRVALDVRCDCLQVADELPELGFAVVRAQNRRRVHSRECDGGELRLEWLAALLRHTELSAEERLRGGRPKSDEQARLADAELGVEPRPAGGDLRPVRLLVNAPLSACRPLEVLDGIRHVDLRAVDASLLERAVKQLPRRADERPALLVLLVAGLLADEHHLGFRGALAEHRLRPGLQERAGLAAGGRLAELGKRGPRRNERCGRILEKALLSHSAPEATRGPAIPCVSAAPW